jgi:hypothetical protein
MSEPEEVSNEAISNSTTTEKKYPDYVEERLRDYSDRYNITLEELYAMFEQVLSIDFVQKDPQFKNDDDRYNYVLKVLYARLSIRKGVKEYTIIPFGLTDIRVPKSGEPISRIYALVKGDKGLEKRVILARGSVASIVNDIQLFSAYKVSLLDWKGVLMVDSMTVFKDPVPIKMDPIELLRSQGFRQITIRESVLYPSNMAGNYVDEMDLRLIDGIVVRYNYGKRANGTNWAVYSLVDTTSPVEDEVTQDGKIIPNTLTVWIPFQFLKWDKDSEIVVCGTVQLTKEGMPFMNAVTVYPIHSIPLTINLEEGEE